MLCLRKNENPDPTPEKRDMKTKDRCKLPEKGMNRSNNYFSLIMRRPSPPMEVVVGAVMKNTSQ